MAGGVPVLREDDVVEAWRDAMDERNDGVALGHGQGAAGAEIVLDIGDDQEVAGRDFHLCLLCRALGRDFSC